VLSSVNSHSLLTLSVQLLVSSMLSWAALVMLLTCYRVMHLAASIQNISASSVLTGAESRPALHDSCWVSAVAEKARTHIETGAAAASRYIEEAGDKLEQRYSGTDNPRQLDPKTKAR